MLIPPKQQQQQQSSIRSKMMSATDDDRDSNVNDRVEEEDKVKNGGDVNGVNDSQKEEEEEEKVTNGAAKVEVKEKQEEREEEAQGEENADKSNGVDKVANGGGASSSGQGSDTIPSSATGATAVSRGFVHPAAAAAASNNTSALASALAKTQLQQQAEKASELKPIPVGEPGIRAKLRFDVVTARVVEAAGKKHVTYSIMMKRLNSPESHAVVIERRYNDFCFVYECILRNFHPSVLGDFLFPKKVLIGNFKAEVITERTEAFHKFLNLIANCDNLLYSDYFYAFLSSEEHNEAVSHIKLSRYEEAIPLLENIFQVREKLLTISNIHVLQCLCELVSTLHAVGRNELAFSYAQVAARSFELSKGHPEAEPLRVPFLKLASWLSTQLNRDPKVFDRQLAELRYRGARLETAKTLLEVIRERYIHRASHTAKLA